MKFWLFVCLAPLLLAGCRSNRFAPFSPYGSATIPPPATGSLGHSHGYNQPVAGVAPLQAVPSLSNQPVAPGEPKTSALTPANPDLREDLESAEKPTIGFGASANPIRGSVARNEPQRAMPRNLRNSNNLAWVPPFHRGDNSVASVTSRPYPAYVAPPIYTSPTYAASTYAPSLGPLSPRVAEVSAQGSLDPQYISPVRPAIVRSPVVAPAAPCDCGSPNAQDVAQPRPYDSAATSNLNWQSPSSLR